MVFQMKIENRHGVSVEKYSIRELKGKLGVGAVGRFFHTTFRLLNGIIKGKRKHVYVKYLIRAGKCHRKTMISYKFFPVSLESVSLSDNYDISAS